MMIPLAEFMMKGLSEDRDTTPELASAVQARSFSPGAQVWGWKLASQCSAAGPGAGPGAAPKGSPVYIVQLKCGLRTDGECAWQNERDMIHSNNVLSV